MRKPNIRDFTLDELKAIVSGLNERPYRAEQLFNWIYKKGVSDFDRIVNIPETLRENLKNKYSADNLTLVRRLGSKDGTEKFIFGLGDGNFIETPLIPAGSRKTVCISTQVGCRFGCLFCASGLCGFRRNLKPSEILGQILYLKNRLKKKITNYVFMGMGEPLDNYENVVKAILIMNDPKGMKIGARNITVSTCGITPAVKKLGNLKLQVNLSVSLHATADTLRNELVPANRKYPLEGLLRALSEYIKIKGRIITIEYVMIKDKNDSVEEAGRLSKIARRLRAKINLIPFSPIGNALRPSGADRIAFFKTKLRERGVKVTVRESKGRDINAACGQLAGSVSQRAAVSGEPREEKRS